MDFSSPEHHELAPAPAASAPAAAAPVDTKAWAMWCHLSAIGGIFFPSILNIVGPLIVWTSGQNKSPAIDANGKEAVNFQLTMSIVAWLTWFVTEAMSLVSLLLPHTAVAAGVYFAIAAIDIILYIAVCAYWVVMVIVASIRAYNGETYRYPHCIRFLR